MNTKEHRENIYQTKQLNEVSWFQQKPQTSLGFFEMFSVPKNAKIIDVGGGDSLLVDHLLDLGYTNISVLDISAHAIERAKFRLGERASLVHWIVSDRCHIGDRKTPHGFQIAWKWVPREGRLCRGSRLGRRDC